MSTDTHYTAFNWCLGLDIYRGQKLENLQSIRDKNATFVEISWLQL